MSLWAFYFIAGFYLQSEGVLRLAFWWNAALLAVVLLPVPEGLRRRGRLDAARHALAGAAAAWLAWRAFHEPGLVPLEPLHGGVLFAVLAAAEMARRRSYRPMVFAVAALFVSGIQIFGAESQNVADRAGRFFQREIRRSVSLPRRPEGTFDVLFVHLAGFAWSDLDAAGRLERSPLNAMDAVLTGFNGVTTYSAPATLRLMRALCGQVAHANLYRPWPPECSVVRELELRGFAAFAAFNGRERPGQMESLAGVPRPVELAGLPSVLVTYDDKPVYSDLAALQRLWEKRVGSDSRRAVLYYNTATLHGGTHEPKDGWWKEDDAARWSRALDALSADLEKFYAMLEASRRPVVVVLLGESARGLGPHAWDFPMPSDTHVPVGIKWIGAGAPEAERAPVAVPGEVSFLAVGKILERLLERDPFAGQTPRLNGLPETERFTENNPKSRTFRLDEGTYIFGKEKRWIRLNQEALRPARLGSFAAAL